MWLKRGQHDRVPYCGRIWIHDSGGVKRIMLSLGGGGIPAAKKSVARRAREYIREHLPDRDDLKKAIISWERAGSDIVYDHFLLEKGVVMIIMVNHPDYIPSRISYWPVLLGKLFGAAAIVLSVLLVFRWESSMSFPKVSVLTSIVGAVWLYFFIKWFPSQVSRALIWRANYLQKHGRFDLAAKDASLARKWYASQEEGLQLQPGEEWLRNRRVDYSVMVSPRLRD